MIIKPNSSKEKNRWRPSKVCLPVAQNSHADFSSPPDSLDLLKNGCTCSRTIDIARPRLRAALSKTAPKRRVALPIRAQEAHECLGANVSRGNLLCFATVFSLCACPDSCFFCAPLRRVRICYLDSGFVHKDLAFRIE